VDFTNIQGQAGFQGKQHGSLGVVVVAVVVVGAAYMAQEPFRAAVKPHRSFVGYIAVAGAYTADLA
jgi:hypothetical protein